ncbi:MAG TPA: hypothetical protein VEM35_09880, partial [Rhizomicrobium sp.]|nr:hypothetical protein [Rhizomicrobium sp.]
MNMSRAILLAVLVSTPALAQNDMGSMPGMTMPMAKERHKAAAPRHRHAPPSSKSVTDSGAEMPMAKKQEKAPKRPRAFLRPAKPMPGIAMPMKQGHKKAHRQATSPHGSMPGMDMGAPGANTKSAAPNAMPGMNMGAPKAKSASPNAMPGMDMGTAKDKSASPDASQKTMPGMDHMAMGHDMGGMPGMSMTGALGSYPMTRDASGTSWQPDLAEHRGIHAMAGDWSLMGHAMLLGIYDNQSGPRGADKTFAAGMVMGMARREFASGDSLGFRAMLSP